MGDIYTVFKYAPKIMHFYLDVPKGFIGDALFTLTNTDTSKGPIIDFCDISIVEVGDNLPCLVPEKDLVPETLEITATEDGSPLDPVVDEETG